MTEKPYVRGWLAAACALLLAACGNGSDSAGQADAGPTTPAALSFRVAGNAPAGTPWHAQWERFEASIREQPESGLDPQMFVTGQLGNPDAALANTRRGRVQVGGFPLAGAATVVPELNMLLVPFLFENEAEVDYVLDNHLLSAFEDLFREKQLVLLQWVDAGWNNLYGSESLATPTAVSGKALRSQPTIASQVFLESLGADTIPMGYAEVLPALQTGLIKGGESVTPMYLVGGLVGEASHLTLTRHAYDSGVIVANRTWFEGLTDAQRDVIAGAIGEPSLVRTEVRNMVAGMLERSSADGALTLHELDAETREAWAAATAGQAQVLAERVGGRANEILAAIEAGIAEFRAGQGS